MFNLTDTLVILGPILYFKKSCVLYWIRFVLLG